jgi:hypothetical protein
MSAVEQWFGKTSRSTGGFGRHSWEHRGCGEGDRRFDLRRSHGPLFGAGHGSCR